MTYFHYASEHLLASNQLKVSIRYFTWSYPHEAAHFLWHLTVRAWDFSMQDVRQILVHLPLGMDVHGARAFAEVLVHSPLENLEQPLSVEVYWVQQIKSVIDQLLFDQVIKQRVPCQTW